MQGERGESGRARPTVPEAKAAGPTRMAQDRPTRNDVLNEQLARLDTQFVFHVLGPRFFLGEVFVDELPAVDPELLHVLLNLRRFQAHAVRDDEARAARIRFVSIRGRSRCPLISASSVPSPSIATGQFDTINEISSSEGVYWRCWTWRYNGISSLNRSTSSRVGMYRPRPSSRRTMSAMRTLRACPVPPAERIGPA